MSAHPTVADRHYGRLRRKEAAREHGALKFRITLAGGLPVHKSTLSFGNCRAMVAEQAKAGRQIWVREMTVAPVVVLELERKGYGHCFHAGSLLPLPRSATPNWAEHMKQTYIDNYPGGIRRD
jgi:hypothetical protein